MVNSICSLSSTDSRIRFTGTVIVSLLTNETTQGSYHCLDTCRLFSVKVFIH